MPDRWMLIVAAIVLALILAFVLRQYRAISRRRATSEGPSPGERPPLPILAAGISPPARRPA